MLYECYDINNLSSQKLVSVVEVTNFRTYSDKMYKLLNIYTIEMGSRSIPIKK